AITGKVRKGVDVPEFGPLAGNCHGVAFVEQGRHALVVYLMGAGKILLQRNKLTPRLHPALFSSSRCGNDACRCGTGRGATPSARRCKCRPPARRSKAE